MKYLLVIFAALALASCSVTGGDTSTGVPTSGPAQAPLGWPEFCERYPSECEEPE